MRAFNPWPVAETRWLGRQLRVWEAAPLSATDDRHGADGAGSAPGRVVEAGQGRLVVATGEGCLEVRRLQLAGRSAVSAAEFLNANALADARLG